MELQKGMCTTDMDTKGKGMEVEHLMQMLKLDGRGMEVEHPTQMLELDGRGMEVEHPSLLLEEEGTSMVHMDREEEGTGTEVEIEYGVERVHGVVEIDLTRSDDGAENSRRSPPEPKHCLVNRYR